ncbi:MAG: lipopolysaccharide biosynthesis protein [Verrucomicrobia bacterium]|nr:lipopolysaccharide biosynthesis protein [Verrucomicrobiota bacterium]
MSAADRDPASDHSLRRAAAGYRSTLASQLVRVVCKLAGVVVLARLVSPAGHGIFAMAASLTFLLVLFRDFGAGAAAIQSPTLSENQKTALLRLHVILGFVLAGLCVLLAPLVARYYAEPAVVPVLRLMSLGFILNGLNAWPRTLLQRDLHFGELNRLETFGAVLGTAAMLAAGALGAGAASFAWYLLVSETVMAVEAWRLCPWRPHAPAAGLRPLAATGLHLTAYNVLLYVLQQIDTLLLGRWFGAAPLGLYNRSGQLLTQPATHLATPFGSVLLATLSRLGPGTPDFAKHFRETTNAIAHFTLPVAAICFVLPDEVVRLALGAAWPDAAPILRWLAGGAAANYLTSTLYPLAVALNRPVALMQLTAVALPVTFLGLWLGRPYGVVGLAAGLTCANLLLLVPRLAWTARGTAIRPADWLSAFAGPLATALSLGLGLWLGHTFTAAQPLALRLAASTLGGLLAVALLLLLWPRLRDEFRTLWAHRPFGRPIVSEN